MLAINLMRATSVGQQIEFVGSYATSFAGITSDVTVSLTSLTGGLDSAPAENDLVIVYFGTGSTADRNLVVSGYSEVIELYSNDTYDTNLVVATKLMGATPDTSFTLTGGTLSTSDAGCVLVQVWRNVDPTNSLDVTSTTATGIDSFLCNPPAITPITVGAVIVSGGAGAFNVLSPSGFSYSSSDLDGFISLAQNDTNDVMVGLGYKYWTSGEFNPSTFTSNLGDSLDRSWAAVTLALRPAT